MRNNFIFIFVLFNSLLVAQTKYYDKAIYSLESYDTIDAIKYLTKSIKKNHQPIQGYSAFILAEIYRNNNDITLSLNWYKYTIDYYQECRSCHFAELVNSALWKLKLIEAIGISYYYLGEYNKAVIWFEKAKTKNKEKGQETDKRILEYIKLCKK